MSKVKAKKAEEVKIEEAAGLSKKELYDLNKNKKEEIKVKKIKAPSRKKKTKKTYQHNLGARIFAIIMLILMIGSVAASIFAYLQ